MSKNFAMFGVAGFVAPRHLKAIADTGNRLIAAVDPNDSVGIMDRYFPQAAFFTEVERFDRFLEKQRRRSDDDRAHFVSVCSPNYLHDAHVRFALRVGATAICEKPLVISPWNLDPLQALEEETGGKIRTVLQLRLLPQVASLRDRLRIELRQQRPTVDLTYVTSRGRWYHVSWKGDEAKSGGLAMNIGIHLFDLMMFLFGSARGSVVHVREPDRVSGVLELEHADVRWFLSTNGEDLPTEARAQGKTAFRSLVMAGQELEFSDGFTDLHTNVYREIVQGGGYGIADARPAIELAYRIRTERLSTEGGDPHPLARRHVGR